MKNGILVIMLALLSASSLSGCSIIAKKNEAPSNSYRVAGTNLCFSSERQGSMFNNTQFKCSNYRMSSVQFYTPAKGEKVTVNGNSEYRKTYF